MAQNLPCWRCWPPWRPRSFGPPPPAQAQEATADCGGAGNPLHGRTQKVVDGILGKLSETDCSTVTSTQLAGITGTLSLNGQSLSSLQDGDFAGLSGMGRLRLDNNSLTALPEDLFDGLTSLHTLNLFQNSLSSLPPDVFDGPTSLQNLHLYNNQLSWLPPDVFDGLTSLRELYMQNNAPLACVHAGQFDGLSNLEFLRLEGSKLGNISTGYFAQWSLNNLTTLWLGSDFVASTSANFLAYKAVLPALDGAAVRLRAGDGMSDPICGSIAADTDGSGFHTTVRVQLNEDGVRPNRVRLSGTSGDGVCGSETGEERHNLWTWQRSADGVTWADMDSARQPPDYGARTAGQCSFIYTPHADDNTMYVRAYVPVTTTGITDAQDYHSAAFGPLNVQ